MRWPVTPTAWQSGMARSLTADSVSNAVSHTPAGTAVDVRVAAEDDEVTVEVRDDGEGARAVHRGGTGVRARRHGRGAERARCRIVLHCAAAGAGPRGQAARPPDRGEHVMRTKLATYALAGTLGRSAVAGAALLVPAASYAATGDSTAWRPASSRFGRRCPAWSPTAPSRRRNLTRSLPPDAGLRPTSAQPVSRPGSPITSTRCTGLVVGGLLEGCQRRPVSALGQRRSRRRLRYALPSRPPGRRALVAQRIEHLTTDQEVAGSNPAERTEKAQVRGVVPVPAAPLSRLVQPRLQPRR